MAKIFIVEDDEHIRSLVLYALGSAGFEAAGFENGREFFSMLEHSAPGLVLLDIMLPDMDGLEILKRLRADAAWRELPVIMLTARGGELDRVTGLDLGADDYITKPFSVFEMISRIKAVLRRGASAPGEGDMRLGEIELSAEKRTVLCGKIPVSLTYKEFELLRFLMQNRGIVLTRDRLLSELWGYDYEGESRTVDMHIKTLRQKLGDAGACVRTIRGVGYKIEP